MLTSGGFIKRTPLSAFANIRAIDTATNPRKLIPCVGFVWPVLATAC